MVCVWLRKRFFFSVLFAFCYSINKTEKERQKKTNKKDRRVVEKQI